MSLCQLANNALKNLGRGGTQSSTHSWKDTELSAEEAILYARWGIPEKSETGGEIRELLLGLGVAFFATGFLLGFKMYIFLTLEFFIYLLIFSNYIE